MTDMMHASQTDRVTVKEKELMTTKRAFTMLPHCSGKIEEHENWRFLMVQFLSQEPYIGILLERTENESCSEEQHFLAVHEKNILHEQKGHGRYC